MFKSYVLPMVIFGGLMFSLPSLAESSLGQNKGCSHNGYGDCVDKADKTTLENIENIETLIAEQQKRIDEALYSLDNLDEIDNLSKSGDMSELDNVQKHLHPSDQVSQKDVSMQIGKKLSGNKALVDSLIDKSDLSEEQKQKLKLANKQGAYQGADSLSAGLAIDGIGYIAFDANMDGLQDQQAKIIRKILGMSANKRNLDKAIEIADTELNGESMQEMDKELQTVPKNSQK